MRAWTTRWMGPCVVALLIGLPASVGAQSWTAPAPTDKVENGVNWTRHFIQARGIGVAPPTAVNAEHGRALAITAATVLARQELLAIARGVTVDSLTTVQAAMVQSSVTEARVSGVIRGAQVVDVKDLGGGAVEVTVAIPATGDFADLVIPMAPSRVAPPMPVTPTAATPPAPPRPAPAASTPSVVYTGLVVDARGLGVKPAMVPKVVSEGGQEVYGFSVVDRNWVIQQGMAGYAKDLRAAQAHERVSDRPLTIKGVRVTGANSTDIVIANTDAELMLTSGTNLGFLEKARVMLVVD